MGCLIICNPRKNMTDPELYLILELNVGYVPTLHMYHIMPDMRQLFTKNNFNNNSVKIIHNIIHE